VAAATGPHFLLSPSTTLSEPKVKKKHMQRVEPNAIEALAGSPKDGVRTLMWDKIPDGQQDNDTSTEATALAKQTTLRFSPV
jgi:hypothetical protein